MIARRGDTNNQLLTEEKNKTKKNESLASKDCAIDHLSPEREKKNRENNNQQQKNVKKHVHLPEHDRC